MDEISESNIVPTQIMEKSDKIPATNADDPSHAFYIHRAYDPSHAFYIHRSDYFYMNIVSTIFDNRSYGGWRTSVIMALLVKNKLGFINGSLVVPTDDVVLSSKGLVKIITWFFSYNTPHVLDLEN